MIGYVQYIFTIYDKHLIQYHFVNNYTIKHISIEKIKTISVWETFQAPTNGKSQRK